MKLLFSLSCLLLSLSLAAQPDTSHLRISLLTVGPGHREIYEPFGHTGVRVVDSLEGTDIVYNYGTFNYNEGNFELKFMQGKLLYYISTAPFPFFMEEYVEAQRKVEEQVLKLGGKEKTEILAFLKNNLEPGNRYYKYDFFFDNCATRIRDILPKTFGSKFQFGQAIPPDSKITFRQIINQYLYKEHLERFGINILLGSRIDAVMSNKDIMFLPDYLREGIGNATVEGVKVADAPVTILPGNPQPPAGINWGFVLTLAIMILTILGLTVNKLRFLGSFMSTLVLFVTGLLGVLIFVMWFGTDHQGCQNNYNFLWALPTNLVVIFRRKNADRYAIIAIVLLLVSFVLHMLSIQKLPLLELSPLLLSLLFIYGTIYRRKLKA